MKKLIILVALVAACKRVPTRWVGLDPADASCIRPNYDSPLTCVSKGRAYLCVPDNNVIRCAPVGEHITPEKP